MKKNSSSKNAVFNKFTVGFVCQRYQKNSSGRFVCIHQEFIAGDEVQYENSKGEAISPQKHDYQPFNMVLLSGPQIANSIRKVLNQLKSRKGFSSELQALSVLLKHLG